MSTPRKFITYLITASVIVLALIAFVVPALADDPPPAEETPAPPVTEEPPATEEPAITEEPPAPPVTEEPTATEEPPAADQPAGEPVIAQGNAVAGPALTEVLQATGWVVPLNPSHVGATNPGFGEGTCPTPPAGQENWFGWHFVTTGNSNFLALSVTFQNAGTFSADPFPGGVFVAHPDNSHAYIWTPGPDTLLAGTATVDKQISQFNLSHVCPGYMPLTASKTAAGTYNRDITWTLDKSVDDDEHIGQAGQLAGSSIWTVVATKTIGAPYGFAVTGRITVTNPNGVPVGFSVSDVLDDGTAATVTCDTYTVPANGTVECTYVAYPLDNTATSNTATITSLVPGVGGATATDPIEWTEKLIGPNSLTLSDPLFEYSEVISSSTTVTFSRDYYCPGDPSLYVNGYYTYFVDNEATLNGIRDNASLQVKCTLPALEPEKTAFGSWDRTVTWELGKSVTPASHVGFAGDTFTSTWTVDATKTETLGNYRVTGEIKIKNLAAIPQTFTVSDVLSDGTVATVTCPTFTVAAGATVTCTYEANLEDASAESNSVTVSAPGNLPQTASEKIKWTENLIGYDSGTLSDPHLGYGPTVISASTTFTQAETFECSDNPADYSNGTYSYTVLNTAYLNGDLHFEASVSVTVTCYAPVVTKDAHTSFTRTHKWDIAKSVATEYGYEHMGYPKVWLYTDGRGDETATWTVDVTYEGYEDSDWMVQGKIDVYNPAPIPATITGLSDVVSLDIAATVDCGVDFPYDLPAGETLTCTYGADLPDGSERVNTATAVLNQLAFTGTADVKFGDPTTEVNKTVTVKDVSDLFGEVALGSATAPDGATFTYTKDFAFADYQACGDYTYNNTATIVETGQSASATLKVNVQCYMYETAYAKGNPAICFIPTFKNWGWTNPIMPGTYEWPLWAAAAQCDTSKGTLAGSVTVVYGADGYVTVTYNLFPGFKLQETHVYAGYDKFPKVGKRTTVAPGAYTNSSPFNGSQVYVIAHAVVGIPDPKFGPPAP